MRVPVLTAVSDAVWEARLVAALEQGDAAGQLIAVVRRCVDLADLLAAASTGSARAVLLSADLRRLDREALARLEAAGVAVLGLAAPDDEAVQRRLLQLGVRTVLPTDASPAEVAEAVLRVVGEGTAPRPEQPAVEVLAPVTTRGQLVAVWGPTGAPGRTTVAVGVAAELAARGSGCLLVDADPYGGVVAQVLGLLEEAPGLAGACRAANAGALDVLALAALAREVAPGLRLLSGLPRADRWPELRRSALEVVLDVARLLSPTTVVDCGFGLEQDEELSYDTAAPQRNGATLQALGQADTVLAVGSADPVGLHRLVRGLAELREALPDVQPVVVVNRLRPGAVPGDAAAEVRSALSRYAGVERAVLLPYDLPALDGALATGRSLPEAAPASALRRALGDLAAALSGEPRSPRRRALLRRSG